MSQRGKAVRDQGRKELADAMAAAHGRHMIHVVRGELGRIEAAAVAAVDLNVEECRCYPAGRYIRRFRGKSANSSNSPVVANDFDWLTGRIMACMDSHGEQRPWCRCGFAHSERKANATTMPMRPATI